MTKAAFWTSSRTLVWVIDVLESITRNCHAANMVHLVSLCFHYEIWRAYCVGFIYGNMTKVIFDNLITQFVTDVCHGLANSCAAYNSKYVKATMYVVKYPYSTPINKKYCIEVLTIFESDILSALDILITAVIVGMFSKPNTERTLTVGRFYCYVNHSMTLSQSYSSKLFFFHVH